MNESFHIKTYYNEDKLPPNFTRTDKTYKRIPLSYLVDSLKGSNPIFQDLFNIRSILPSGTYMAGSSVMAAFAIDFNFSPNYDDVDIFCFDQRAFEEAHDNLLRKYDPKGPNVFSHLKKSSDKIRYLEFNCNGKTIQLLKHWWFTDAESVIDSFDFTVCQFALDKEYIIFNPESLFHLRDKALHIHRHVNNYKTLVRLKKYVAKGFSPSPCLIDTMINEIKGSHGECPVGEQNGQDRY